MYVTYTRATHENNQQGLHDAGHSNNPRQSEEENDAKNVLETWKVDSHQSAHVGRLIGTQRVRGKRGEQRQGRILSMTCVETSASITVID